MLKLTLTSPLQVIQREASNEDLRSLCEGCLFDVSNVRGGELHGYEPLIHGLCCAFEEVSSTAELLPGKKAFAQRDFVFFLRSLRRASAQLRTCGTSLREAFVLSFATLIQSLRRNFNGISVSQFGNLVTRFLECCSIEVPELCTPAQAALMTAADMTALRQREVSAPRPLDVLRIALLDVHQNADEMNNAPFRHLLVVDETGSGR